MSQKLSVVWRAEEESWNTFLRRLRETAGDVVVVFSSADNVQLLQEEERTHVLDECRKLRYRIRIATKEPAVMTQAKSLGIRVLDRTRQLRMLLHDHPKQAEALRHFSPSLWRQQWRSRLQTAGLLSLPKVRILILISLSAGLFLFVLFRLLPSADVQVWPRSDLITQTMNITLTETGAVLPPSGHVRIQPLQKIRVRVHKSIVFADISPEFTGTDAEVRMTVVNQSPDPVSLRKGTRFLNQAGMIFRLKEEISVLPHGSGSVLAKADHLDLYGKVIGARGNVPAGLQWELPGLSADERKLISGKNLKPGTGGTTSERTVLQQKDIDAGKKRLSQELLLTAKQLVEEERKLRNGRDPTMQLQLFTKNDVINATYSGFILPTGQIGQAVKSITIQGELIYTVPGYNIQELQAEYSRELQAHTSEGKKLLPDSVHLDPQRVIIIEFADDGSWVKITADILGTEQFVLDPLTPVGAEFGKKVRDAIAGLPSKDAQRILRNFPEVDRIEIRLWPPWNSRLPDIPSNITISPQR